MTSIDDWLVLSPETAVESALLMPMISSPWCRVRGACPEVVTNLGGRLAFRRTDLGDPSATDGWSRRSFRIPFRRANLT